MFKRSGLVVAIMSCLTMPVFVEASNDICHAGYEDEFLPVETSATLPDESEVDVKANQVQIQDVGTSIFSGDVEVKRAGQQLNADRATYNKQNGDVRANGDVVIKDSDMRISAERAEWSTTQEKAACWMQNINCVKQRREVRPKTYIVEVKKTPL